VVHCEPIHDIWIPAHGLDHVQLRAEAAQPQAKWRAEPDLLRVGRPAVRKADRRAEAPDASNARMVSGRDSSESQPCGFVCRRPLRVTARSRNVL
jgi:hypothetical protein